MSYNPAVRGMYLTCEPADQNSSPYAYFGMIDITMSDYNNLVDPGEWAPWFTFLGMFPQPTGNFWGCTLPTPFTAPNPGDEMVSVLLPGVPGINNELFPNFSIGYTWLDSSPSWDKTLAVNGAVSKSGGTISPPRAQPIRDEGQKNDAIDDPITFLLQSSTNNNTPTGFGVVINIPENCLNWMKGAPDANDSSILALTVPPAAGNPAGLAVYSQEILGNYKSVYVIFPDGSQSDTVPIDMNTMFKI
ncbi:MAG: hypothetical protein K9G49_03265 [Taibaiella sp.]|nr:hypothetical protein [Taibaiella sp.]